MHPKTMCWPLIMVGASLMLISIYDIYEILHEPIGILEIVQIVARIATGIISGMICVLTLTIIIRIRPLDRGEPIDLDPVLSAISRMGTLSDALIWSVLINDLIAAARHFVAHEPADAALDILLAAFLLWIMRRGGGNKKKKPLGKLIGEKSKALLNGLIKAQKGMRPSPNPA